MSILRFPPYADLRRSAPLPSFWQRVRGWFQAPPKAPVFQYKNPTQWKLDNVRRKARSAL